MRIQLARLAAATLLVSLFAALAGLPPTVAAQPGPEQQKLQYWNGTWRVESEIKPSASFAGGKLSGTESCEMFANLHVVCTSELTGPTGLYRSKRTISYVPALKQYAQYTIDSLGYASLAMGSLQGSTWTFTTDLGSAKIRGVTKASGASASTTNEYAGADGKWVVTATSKATRAK
jgi:Protein of unknown function (DUF1579)